jgi:hypothetical protein
MHLISALLLHLRVVLLLSNRSISTPPSQADSAAPANDDEAPKAPSTPPESSAPEAAASTAAADSAAADAAPKEGEEALEEGEIPPDPSAAPPKKAEDPRVAAELERQVRPPKDPKQLSQSNGGHLMKGRQPPSLNPQFIILWPRTSLMVVSTPSCLPDPPSRSGRRVAECWATCSS